MFATLLRGVLRNRKFRTTSRRMMTLWFRRLAGVDARSNDRISEYHPDIEKRA
jgi:hypothetical protein